ncbi:MAG TPA: response regulator transcription factor [Acidimicrobiia bacterium]|jgi:two-component system phosphate regulon response regulator PhoB|nr:response regulator transcription factor [Acidimicrobiia bacterium]
MALLQDDRDWLRQHLGPWIRADGEDSLVEDISASQLPVAAFDVAKRRLLGASARGYAMLGFTGVDLATLDLVDAASDPDACIRLHALILDGHIAEWKYSCLLRSEDGSENRGVAFGRAVAIGQSHRLTVGLFAPETRVTPAHSSPDLRNARLRVLIAHGDEAVRARMRHALANHGLVVDDVKDMREVFVAAHRQDEFVLVVGSGLLEGTANLNDLAAGTPGRRGVLVVVGEADEHVVQHALDAGLDYVRDVAIEQDLAARVRALVLRKSPDRRSSLDFGDLHIDLDARDVRVGGRSIAFTAREFDLLAFLASEPRVAFSREELLKHVWHSSPDWQGLATVTEHVRRIRDKLQPHGNPTLIRTVRGMGYLFQP